MTEESHSFPERPHTHVVGEAALSAFKFKRPQEWNITESKTDYGWDVYVEIPEAGRMKGLAFSVQLKGTDSLIEPLKELIRQKGKSIGYADLREHPILNVYLNEFAESVITIDSLARVAVDWWFAIVFDRDLPIDGLQACLEGPSRALVLWRTISGVIEKVEDEPEKRAAALWAAFLWRCYRRDDGQVDTVWRSIKDCCSRIFPEQFQKHRTILFQHMPMYLYQIVSQEPGLSLTTKLTLYVSLPWKLPPGDADRAELEQQFLNYSRKLSR